MSAREWAPGTVAVATVRGVKGVRVFKGVACWAFIEDGQATWIADSGVHNARPLVVLDGDFPLILKHLGIGADAQSHDAAIDFIAKQIEEQTRLPKPVEPTGLGAVVETADGEQFIRSDLGWHPVGYLSARNWPDLDVARVLSEGVRNEGSRS